MNLINDCGDARRHWINMSSQVFYGFFLLTQASFEIKSTEHDSNSLAIGQNASVENPS